MFTELLTWIFLNILSDNPKNVTAEKIRTAFSKLMENVESVVTSAGTGLYKGNIEPTSAVPGDPNANIFLIATPGTYLNFKKQDGSAIILSENSFGFIFRTNNGFVLNSVIIPQPNMTAVNEAIERMDDFIRDFAVTTDLEFDSNSNNPIANKAVAPLANVLDSFLNFINVKTKIELKDVNFGYVLNDGEIAHDESENKYIIVYNVNTEETPYLVYNAYQAMSGNPITSRVVSILAITSNGNKIEVLNSQRAANNPLTIVNDSFKLPNNTTKLYLSWSNYKEAKDSIPEFFLVNSDNKDAVINYINSEVENVQIGEEINGRNLFEIADKNDNPILEIDTDGVLKVKGLETDIIKRSVNASSTNLSGIVSDEPKINLPKPNHIAKVVIHGFPYNVDSAVQDEVECMLEFNDGLGNGFHKKTIVAVQGSTSQGLPKKNLAIDFFNEDGSEFFVQFGDWVSLSSFHLKAEYWCVWHYRSLFSSQLFEQIDMSRPWHLQKPWRAPYAPNNATYNQRFNTGARGHIDGFPVEVYIEDTFIGIYNFNQKKHRSNYEMTKDNLNQIIVDSAGTFNAYFKNDIETAWEIRNPSGLLAIDGTKYAEGKELSNTDPKSLEVKNKIKRFFGWGKNVAVANLKAEAPNYLHIERTIDWFLHCHFLYTPDNYIRNTIWCTWDGARWAPMVWDLEAVLGMGIFGYANEIPPTKIGFVGGGYNHADGDGVFNPKFYQAFKTEIEGRYKELRDLGIFTTKNVSTYFINREKEVPYEIFKKDMDMMLAPTNRPPNSIFPDGHTGGFFDSVPRIEDWLGKRIITLDAYFKYTK